jgi:exodeoxyribonuclease VII small subunit
MAPDADRSAEAAEDVELSFEAALERLEAIIDQLEGGDLPLEEALASFERGVRLSRRLGEQLAGAERRIEVLMREGGHLVKRSLEDSEEAS